MLDQLDAIEAERAVAAYKAREDPISIGVIQPRNPHR